MSWSARQYTTFEAERTRPVRDLVAAIPTATAVRLVDLGCGPGNSTEVLCDRYPDAEALGIDSSPDMIAAARKRLPGLRFQVGAIEGWGAPAPVDVILANAVLHWIDDHETLLPHLLGQLAPGGSLAVQMPDNMAEPALALMQSVAAEGPWAGTLATVRGRGNPESATWYYDVLAPHCARVDVWRTTYHHVLAGGADAVVEWFKGSALTPLLAALDEEMRAGFLAAYREAVAVAYPARADGSVLLPFPRLFFVATR
jgi:trans-aconitate 2-methyltransferase